MSRKRVSRELKIVALWMPRSLLAALDNGVRLADSDRSKYIRAALREKIERSGIEVSTQEAA